MEINCQIRNCNNKREPTNAELIELEKGNGIALWKCDECKRKDTND